MEVVLRRYGNSTVVVLPPPVLRELGITAGHHMSLQTTEDGRIVLSRKRKYTLAEMIAQCDTNAAPPADIALWVRSAPAGQEVW